MGSLTNGGGGSAVTRTGIFFEARHVGSLAKTGARRRANGDQPYSEPACGPFPDADPKHINPNRLLARGRVHVVDPEAAVNDRALDIDREKNLAVLIGFHRAPV